MRSFSSHGLLSAQPTGVTAAAAAAMCTTAARSRTVSCCAVAYGTAGDVMLALNQPSLGRNNPRLRRVKDCIDKAVYDTFSGHASVEHQGSTRKGTGLQGSDWDFFVHLDDTITNVTHKQHMVIVDLLRYKLLPDAGIDYSLRCGSNRVFMWNGSDGNPLPDVDVVFERFKQDVRKRPKSRALAHSPVAQQVVKYIKRLPVRFTQLGEPKSSLVERLVLQLQWQQFGNTHLSGAEGFVALLTAVLEEIASQGDHLPVAPAQALVDAELDSLEWKAAAVYVLEKQQDGLGWLIV